MGLLTDTIINDCMGQHRHDGILLAMLAGKKKLLAAVAEWTDGRHRTDRKSGWDFGKDFVRISPTNTAFNLWSIWRLGGQWPLGNWLDQPLSLLIEIEAIDTVYWTWKEYRYQEKPPERPRGIASMDGTQRAIVGALESDE